MLKKLAFIIVVGAASPYVRAQDIAAPASHSYSQNSGGTITRSAFGLCWRSGSWTENDAIAGCDGALASPIPNPTAPDVVATSTPATQVLTDKSCAFAVLLSSDQTFAFNKSVLRSAAKRQIDRNFLPRLTDCKTIESVTLIGHTDNLGSAYANQFLSKERAQAVADYLKAQMPSTKMNIIGVGSTQALKSCNEKLSRSKLISCLAPNRRVLIVVTN